MKFYFVVLLGKVFINRIARFLTGQLIRTSIESNSTNFANKFFFFNFTILTIRLKININKNYKELTNSSLQKVH